MLPMLAAMAEMIAANVTDARRPGREDRPSSDR